MLKLLIVDDEQFTRDCLVQRIPWENYGARVIATASDGLEALSRMEEALPDILITDIKMPKMNGIDLLRAVRERFPSVDAIMISGYEEFEYAKGALNLGAKRYLLKPIDPAELIDAVLGIKEQRKAMGVREPAQTVAGEYLRCMLYSCYTPEQVEDAMGRFSEFDGKWFSVVELQLDNVREILQGQPISVYNALVDAFREYCRKREKVFLVEKNPRNMVFVLVADQEEELVEETKRTLEAIEGGLKKQKYLDYAIGLSRPVARVENLSAAYLEAMRTASMKYVYGNGRVFRPGERYEFAASAGSSLERMENLVKYTVNYAPEEVERLLREQFLEMRRRKVCLQETQQFARALIGNVLEKLTELDLRIEEIYTDPSGIILTICTSQSNSEIMDRVHVFLNTVGRYAREHRGATPDQLTQFIREHIEKNYMDPQLSTRTIAENLHFNAAYVSALFSASSRTTVTNYINKVRIDNACALLKNTDQRISDIAQSVGYMHNSYFCTVFKRAMGLSPSDYRNLQA